MKSISKLLVQAFHPEQMDPELWLDEGPGAVYAEDMANDISALYELLGLDTDNHDAPNPFLPTIRLILGTTRQDFSPNVFSLHMGRIPHSAVQLIPAPVS
jgi:hypothetical protein